MLKEITKLIYLFFVFIFSRICFSKTNEKQVVYLTSFAQMNNEWLYMLKERNVDLTILYFTKNLLEEEKLLSLGVKCIPVSNNFTFIVKHIPFIIKSNTIIIDNYFGFLSSMKKNSNMEIIQIWHANGSIKKFGLSAKQNNKRSNIAKKRFKRVYDSIDTYVVASEEMKNVFEESYLAKGKNFLMYGYYALDNVFKEGYVENCLKNNENKYPNLKDKKVLLYVPTYREKNKDFISLDIIELSKSIGDEWEIVVKFHPHMKNPSFSKLNNVTVLNKNVSIVEFLPTVDCLISDYSSIIFDYSLIPMKKKLYIYATDYNEYCDKVGVNDWFDDFYRENCIKDVDDLCKKLLEDKYFDHVEFNSTWNKYNNGDACLKIVDYIVKSD